MKYELKILQCKICGIKFPNKDQDGQPTNIGGLMGIAKDQEGYKVIDLDFCEKHFFMMLQYIKMLYDEYKKNKKTQI